MSLPFTTPSSSPHALSTHATASHLPDTVTDIMARRVDSDGVPFDPAALEPIPDTLLTQLQQTTEELEQVRRERAAALAKAAAADRKAREALARAQASESVRKSVLAKKDTFTRLWVKELPHPAVSLEIDQASGRTVAHISVILNEVPEKSDYQGRTSYIVGETVLPATIPWHIQTSSGSLPVLLKGSLRLTLTKDSTVDYTETQRTGILRTDPVDPDESERSRSQTFIPSTAGIQTTKDTTGTGGPNNHDLIQSRVERLGDAEHTHATRISRSLLDVPPSVAQAALLAALNDITPRALPK